MTSTSYPESRQDWRGRFIASMVESLSSRDDVSLSLWAPPGDIPARTIDATTVGDARWLKRLSRSGGIAHLLRTRRPLAAGTILTLLGRLARVYRRPAFDVIHVNWLQNAFPLLGTRTPALMTVLGTDFGLLTIPGMKVALRTVFRTRRTVLAPNAEWMNPTLEDMFGDVAEVRTIPFGVDDAWFRVTRSLSTNDTRHWLAITRLTRNKIGDLFEWGEGLFGEHRRLHLFGPMQEHISIPSWVDYHGPTHPNELLRDWFPTAHGLITLSRHDEGRPQVMLEAMAAGLPVLASDLPAHRNLIAHGENGWLVPTRETLTDALAKFDDDTANQSLGTSARRWVKEHIGTWDDCAERYARAYHDLLEVA